MSFVNFQSVPGITLEASRKSAAGFADQLIAEIFFDSGVGEIITFDKAFRRRPGVRRLK